MIWQVPKIWDGGECWIIGGGPSILRQFEIPDEVIRNVVVNKAHMSAYSPYFAPLHDKHIIGINVAYLLGDWVDMVFFGDAGFFNNHKEKLAAFPRIKASCHPTVTKSPWVKYLGKDKKGRGISPTNGMVCWNGNSGAAAISLAVHTGVKRIILLGFDMTLDEQARQHIHSLYSYAPAKRGGIPRKLPFDRHLQGFPTIAHDAKQMGVEILNASPNSTIQEFRKVTVKELLQH